eukprot:4786502-Pleurochrysis_carterae.AAC.5
MLNATGWLQSSSRAGTDSGHLKIAWPASRAINGQWHFCAHSLPNDFTRYEDQSRCFGRQISTHLAECEPVYLSCGPSLAYNQLL